MQSFAAINLTRIPLNMRAPKTQWPVENRASHLIVPESTRNIGSRLFRRYHNGRLDMGWAKGIVREALFKSSRGIPLTELEACAVSAVYPEIRFEGLPKAIVDIKARLSQSEADSLRTSLEREVEVSRLALGSGYDF